MNLSSQPIDASLVKYAISRTVLAVAAQALHAALPKK